MIGSAFSVLTELSYFAPAAQAHLGLIPSREDQSLPSREINVLSAQKPAIPPPEAANEATGREDQDAGSGLEQELTEEERKQVAELEKRDAEVRRHEEAHFRTGGRYASPPQYEYQTGPDGKRYAVGGSVDIDTSEVPEDPQATIEKARIIKRAALAPEEPSTQDRKVAREADQMAAEAMRELAETKQTETLPADEPAPAPSDPHAQAEATTAAVTTVPEADSRLAFEVPSAHQSLIRYKTSKLQQVYLPTSTPLHHELHRVPLLPLFDRYA